MSDQNENSQPEQPEENQATEAIENAPEPAPQDDAPFSIETVIADAKKVIFDPVGFYKNMSTSGGYADPIIFVAVMALAGALISTILSMIGLAKFNAITMGMGGFKMIFIYPVLAVIGSFIGAAILFVVWKLMGSERDYETAYRCTAYTMAITPVISVISVVPYLANAIKTLWIMLLFYLASVHVHALKEQTAKIVFGVLAAIFVLSGFSSEREARKWLNKAERWEERVERSVGKMDDDEYRPGSIGSAMQEWENTDVENMTPEEAGEKAAELLKGLERFAESMEENLENDQKEE